MLAFLILKGFHPRLGARPMRDAVEKFAGDADAADLLTEADDSGCLVVGRAEERLAIPR